jgi:hypothetical protein
MRRKSVPEKEPAIQVVKNIRRATRRHFSAEDKIRIVRSCRDRDCKERRMDGVFLAIDRAMMSKRMFCSDLFLHLRRFPIADPPCDRLGLGAPSGTTSSRSY